MRKCEPGRLAVKRGDPLVLLHLLQIVLAELVQRHVEAVVQEAVAGILQADVVASAEHVVFPFVAERSMYGDPFDDPEVPLGGRGRMNGRESR